MIQTNTYASLLERLRPILIDMGVSPSTIIRQAHFIRDLGLDSLDHVDLMMRMEREFFLSITDEQMTTLQTVEQALHFLQEELTPTLIASAQGDKNALLNQAVGLVAQAQPRQNNLTVSSISVYL